MLKKIQQKINTNDYQITRHAQRRCDSRGISLDEIKQAIIEGEIIENYPKDAPYPSCLIMGFIRHHQPLYVLCALGKNVHIITIHWLDPAKWLDPKTRREKI